MTKKTSVASLLAVLLLATVTACSQEPTSEQSASPSAPEAQSSDDDQAPAPTRGSATASESTAKTTEISAAKNTLDCSVSAVQKNPEYYWVNSVNNCDGTSLVGGEKQTDHIEIFYVANGQWKLIPRDETGMTNTGFQCYSTATLDKYDISDSARSRITICDGSASNQQSTSDYVTVAGMGEWYEPVSMPQCDGRNILIVNSVHLPGNPKDQLAFAIGKAIMSDNDLKYTTPGKCSSLRAQVDGEDVYPIYYDFGTSQQAMCEAKKQYGGNARTLNNLADFSDPC